MRVYLMRHGKPEPAENRPERPLSNEGRNDVERIADFLRRAGTKIEQALHSGRARSRETATIMASRLNPELEPQESPGLAPLDDVIGIANQIRAAKKDLLIAGHMPHLGKLMSLLVVGDQFAPLVKFPQGCVVCLERDETDRWSTVWILVPEIM
jgi:phosphohistidine phosphatase